MYYWLINATKRRLIEELRESFIHHPYYSKIQVQDKFSFKERPQFAIVVKGSSGDRVVLSPQNFIGVIHSYCLQATVGEHPGMFLEWIREDTLAIHNNDHVFPSSPGIYLLEVLSIDDEMVDGTVALDMIDSVFDEEVFEIVTGEETDLTLDRLPIDGSLRIHLGGEHNFYHLVEGTEYERDGQAITLLDPLLKGTRVFADYKVIVGSSGPHPFTSFYSDNTIIPGVVLAFGNRIKVGDKCAIIVTPERGPAFEEYGGHFIMSFDLDSIAVKDSTQSEQINDYAIMSLLRDKLKFEDDGLTIVDGPTIGGESEDVYDEEGDEHYFSNSFSVSFQTDWAYYKPLPITVSQVVVNTVYTAIINMSEVRELDIEKYY